MTKVDVDPSAYYGIGTALREAASDLNHGLITLAGLLNGTGSMAGSDDGGREWGTDYDAAAGTVFENTDLVTSAAGNFSSLVQQAAYNHGLANFKAQYGANAAGPPSVPPPAAGLILPCAARPPSSVGDSGPGLQGFVELVNKIGVPVPNGNTGNLGSAASGWDTFSSIASGASDKLSRQVAVLDGISAPEIDDVRGHLGALRDECDALATNAKALAESARSHSSELNDTRNQIKDIIEELAEELAIGIAVSVGLALITAGAGALAGAAATSARIAAAAEKITALIQKLKEFLNAKKASGKLKEIADATKQKLKDLASRAKKSIDDEPGAPKPQAPRKTVEIGSPKNFDPNSLRGMSPDDVRSSIPSDWTKTPSKSGGGEVYSDPANKGRQIRIMPGYPPGSRPDPITWGPYAVISQNGIEIKIPLLGNPTL